MTTVTKAPLAEMMSGRARRRRCGPIENLRGTCCRRRS